MTSFPLAANQVYSPWEDMRWKGRRNTMQKKIRHYRVHLVAYDALLRQQTYLLTKLPSPSPTPLAPLVLSIRVLPQRQQRCSLRKVRLTYE